MILFTLVHLCLLFTTAYSRLENIATCKLHDPQDADGQPVDWFILYKLPSTASYVYLTSLVPGEQRGSDIGNDQSPVILTLNGFYSLAEEYSDDLPIDAKDIFRSQLLQLFYSWNYPSYVQSSDRFSRSRGVLIVQTSLANAFPGGGAGVSHPAGAFWLTHSVPSYPLLTSPAWNSAENVPAHLFVCLTPQMSDVPSIITSLYYEQPYIYRWYFPEFEFRSNPEIRRSALDLNPMKFLPNAEYVSEKDIFTVGRLKVKVVSQNEKAASDLSSFVLSYIYRTDKFISWNRRSRTYANAEPDCISEYPVRNIVSPITIAGVRVPTTVDEARWLIADNGPVCILSGPRTRFAEAQSSDGLCFEDANIVQWFANMARNVLIQECT